ncbi:hypothetical protein [Belliella pelovolcani]|uniref:Uncharacterized protein n=1 Tax=Belliella pelovolcani TaxID=529505 RepID=A0A1N7JRH2_9BACT|nr:hypothetical protein [Belliella pelovolcani]SIS51949.1 hypothetical protein SAMN05421761_101214 [Belliella pelovolcani]
MKLLDWYNGLILVGLLFSIPAFFLNIKYKRQHLIVFMILVLGSSLELYGTYTYLRKLNNVPVYNIFFVYLETLLIYYLFYTIYQNKKVQKAIIIGSLLFLLQGLFINLSFENLLVFQSISFTIGSLGIILCCIYYFYNIIFSNILFKERLILNPLFLIVTLIFFFYSTTFVHFSSFNLLHELDSSFLNVFSILIRTMAVLMYLGMGLAFYLPFLTKNTPKA